MTIKNKTVVLTGASSGIGEVTAKLLAKKGAKIVLGARREEKLKEIVEWIEDQGGQATYAVTDVSKRQDNQQLVQTAIDAYGTIDVMFLNAGIMPNSRMSSLQVEDWEAMIDINLKGFLYGIAAALPHFVEQKSGQFIATSSVAGIRNYINCGVYGATKWGLRNTMEVLRKESVEEGTNIRTSTIYPGSFNTELLDSITDADIQQMQREDYDEIGIEPERVAEVVAFAIEQPKDTNISELTVYPTKQA